MAFNDVLGVSVAILIGIAALIWLIRKVQDSLGWEEITEGQYQELVAHFSKEAPDYSRTAGRVDEGGFFPETVWDAGKPVEDTFTRQNGDCVSYKQKPLRSTARCYLRVRYLRWTYRYRIELERRGQTQPCNGEKLYSYITNRAIEFTGPGVTVRFRHTALLDGALPPQLKKQEERLMGAPLS